MESEIIKLQGMAESYNKQEVEECESFEETGVQTCRACANEGTNFKHLHKRGIIMNVHTTLAEILGYCTGISFEERNEGLPEFICGNCSKNLARSYAFKQVVIRSNDLFRAQLRGDCEQIYVRDENSLQTVGQEVIISQEVEGVEDYSEEVKYSEVANYSEANYSTNEQIVEYDAIHVEEGAYSVSGGETDEEQQQRQHIEHEEEVEMLEDAEEETYFIEEIERQEHSQDDESEEQEVEVGEEQEGEICEEVLDEDIEYDFEHFQVVNEADGDQDLATSTGTTGSSRRSTLESSEDDGIEQLEILELDAPPKRRRRNNVKEANPQFKCPQCSKQLSNGNSFKYHMQLHSDDTPFLCSLCGEGFKTRNAYDGHKILHNPNNPNTCHLCGKAYRQNSSLRSHMLTHTGERPYHCDICGKGLTQKSGYKKHMLTHTGEKPHVCDMCGRSFRYSSNLIAHKRSHSEERPYECDMCTKCFAGAEQLKRHKLVHSEERPFSCDLCQKRFKRRASLTSHSQTHRSTEKELIKVARDHRQREMRASPPLVIGEKVVKSNVVELY